MVSVDCIIDDCQSLPWIQLFPVNQIKSNSWIIVIQLCSVSKIVVFVLCRYDAC